MAKSMDALDDQLANMDDKIAQINRQLAVEEENLIREFSKANEAISQMQYLISTIQNRG